MECLIDSEESEETTEKSLRERKGGWRFIILRGLESETCVKKETKRNVRTTRVSPSTVI